MNGLSAPNRKEETRPPADSEGQSYLRKRLARIGFEGDRVLVVGQNAAGWPAALGGVFRKVDIAQSIGNSGVDSRPPTPLSFADESFDALVYDGIDDGHLSVATVADWRRMLKPGGRAYLCLPADAWLNQQLTTDSSRAAAQLALYATVWRRADQLGLQDRLSRFAERDHSPVPNWRKYFKRSIGRIAPLALLSTTDPGRILIANVAKLGPEMRTRLRSDVRRILRGEPLNAAGVGAVQPPEFGGLAAAAGFVDFQWAAEGGLVTDWLSEAVPSRYPGYIDGQLAVWECLLTRPAEIRPEVDPAIHMEAARQASVTPLFLEPSPNPVISNRSTNAFPGELLVHAQAKAALFGGDKYLQRLGQKLVEGADDEDGAARRLIRFVQSSIFRDPVSQPVNEDGSLPAPATILFCARGRCGHCSTLLASLARAAGLESRVTQLANHVTCEIRVNGRWVIADADIFKHGVLPTNRAGELLCFDDLREHPYDLDRFPPTGWYVRPGTRYTRGVGGSPVRGYVDACEPSERGFVSGYYVAEARGYPPSLPTNLTWTIDRDEFRLDWSPSIVPSGRLVEYRVYASTRSRGWTYDDFWNKDTVADPLPGDVLTTATTNCYVEGAIPSGLSRIYASVVAASDRIDREPNTHFQPSEESSQAC